VDVDSNVLDAMTVAIGDIDGVRTARYVPLSELTGHQEARGPGAHGETTR
jgi:hypothetical protein